MPVVIAQPSDLRAFGPIIEAQITPTAAVIRGMQSAGIVVAPPTKVSTLIDTGASRSMIQSGLPQTLGVSAVGPALISTPSSHNFRCDRYLLRLMFFPTAGLIVPVTFDATFIEAPLKGMNIQCLLGRDFLASAVLTYIGPANTFVLSL
jgi:hypothetical protein